MKTILLLDCNYLCHRAFYSTGALSHNDFPTGVIFGFLRDLVTLENLFETDKVVFCFDSNTSLRKQILSTYKESRRKSYEQATTEEKKAKDGLRLQLHLLRTEVLPRIGFANIHHAEGYEADDFIALNAERTRGHNVIIVSSDNDLLQCINETTSIYNPQTKRLFDLKRFRKDFEIEPFDWPAVKAWAGDSGDDIPGLVGVGQKTAVKYVKGELVASKTLAKFVNNHALYQRNLELVRLPFPGTPKIAFKPDDIDSEAWISVAKELGFVTLLDFHLYGHRPKRTHGVLND